MDRLQKRHLCVITAIIGMLGVSSQGYASSFQIWEQSGASIANYHAGYAAEANDASTAFFNPAGITRIQNQQLVVGGAGIMSSFQYNGLVKVISPIFLLPPSASTIAQGGTFSFVPNLHYVAPITDKIGFGFSVDVPFGLKTNYGASTPLRYAATLSSLSVIDVSPSLGIQLTDKASFGLGLDIQRMNLELDSVATAAVTAPEFDTDITNKLDDTAYGSHFGLLYQFTPETRAGISYHSQVVHHLSGPSTFSGPLLAGIMAPSPLISNHATTHITLPPYTALSLYDDVNPRLAFMGSVIYTQWSSFNSLILNNAAGIYQFAPSTDIQVTIPQSYRNTWNLSFGADYALTERIILKGGLGYDQTPLRNWYRNVQLPDNNRYIIALGAHYQASKRVGLDFGWNHFFIGADTVSPPAQVMGDESVVTNGRVSGGADVFGGQVTWDML